MTPRMLKMSGRNGRAAQLLAHASGLADDIGMPLLARRVVALRD